MLAVSDSSASFVVDANFFIQGNGSIQAPRKIYTTAAVLSELGSLRARERFEQCKLVHDIITRDPTSDSIEKVKSCARDSGNLQLLSDQDIGLLALALDFLPTEMPEAISQPPIDEWITPETYGKVEDFPSVICTTDTTMQCVALLLGLRVMSPTGQRISELKHWLLRCAACGAETRDASKEFCPECGSHKMVRYALVVRGGKERELPLPKRFDPTARPRSLPVTPPSRGGPELAASEDMLNEAKRKWKWRGGERAMKRAEGDGQTFFNPRKKPRPEPRYGSALASASSGRRHK
jgi:RNA-binding protein NOB1